MIRRAFLKFFGIGATTVALAGCPRPLPGPDGGGTTPGGVITVVSTIMDVLGVILPILTPFFQRFIPEGTAKAAVLTAAAEVQRVGTDWQAAARVYTDRGGDSCVLFALTGALTELLVRLSRTIVDAGFGWGSEIETLLTDLSLLTDRLIGRCAADAGLAATTARVGHNVQSQLTAITDAARVRGVALRVLPPLQPNSLH